LYTLQKFWKILKRTLLALLLLLVVLYGLLHLAVVQNFIIGKVTKSLSEELNTTVKIDRVDFSFFNKLDLKGLLVKDLKKDTLLYAGTAKINITDWFFLRDTVVLHYAALEDAVVNMNRTDSVWNYQFMADYFASPGKSKKKGGLQFDIKELQLQNIRFNQIDKWVGKNMIVALKNMDLLADTMDFKMKRLQINSLKLVAPVFFMSDYTGNRDKLGLNQHKIKKTPVPGQLQWNPDGWVMNVKKLLLQNGVFMNEIETDKPAVVNQFDGNHLRFSNINGELLNVHFEKDTLTTYATLSTKERSGFEAKKLMAQIKFTPSLMEFKQLDLVTNRSRLGNYYAMRYNDFNADMGDFLHKVTVEGNFVNSEISTDDLAFFAPELKSWKRQIKVKGLAKGTIDNLAAKKMLLQSGTTIVDGDIAMRGLPDIDNTFIDFTARDLQTNYTDLSSIIPQLKNVTQVKLAKLGNIRYKGNFTGFINDFVAYGNINTNLGSVTGDLNLKLPANKPPQYSGKISTQGFQLGQLVNDTQVGAITFSGKVKGSGFTPKTIDANFDGNIQSVTYAGYPYQNIIIKGDFKKRFFKGFASINDPNLTINDLSGTIDLNTAEPQFYFDADLAKADFKKLKLTNDSFNLSGHFNLRFQGSNIDNFLGMANVTNAHLLHNGIPLSFDSLTLQSQIMEDKKYLSLHTNELDAAVKGRFKIMELPDAFKVFLSRYYPAYITKPSYQVSDQEFSFEINTKEVDAYAQLLDKKLKGFDYSKFSGNLGLKNNQLNIDAIVPMFSYDAVVFNNVRLLAKGGLDTLATSINVDEITISDSFHLPATKLVFKSFNDISDISINTSASKTLSDAAINARVRTMSDGFNVHFFPSSFIINDKKWELEKDGEISMSKSQVSASDVKFVQGLQQIVISTEPSSTGNSHDIVVQLTKVNIDDFVSIVTSEPRLEGKLNGTLRITDPFVKPFIEYDANIEEFRTDNDSIGLLNAHGSYDVAKSILAIKAYSENKENQLDIDGLINFKDSTENQTRLALKSDKFNIAILNNYLNSIFSDIKGTANTTDLVLSGNAKHLLLTGTANINEGSLIVNFTQCRYKFKNESIVFNPDEIDFGKIELRDTLNNKAQLSGKMYHQFFSNIEFDNILLETDRLLVLNTTKKDNSQFYGKVIGKARLLLTGKEDNMLMDISGEPSRRDSSHIYILSGNSIENGTIDYIDYIQFGNKMDDNFKTKLSTNIIVNMAITANPSCKVDVILDEVTGDIIKGEGEGLLKIRVGNKEPISIYGRYEITKGEYTFNFQTFLKKYFTVNSGTLIWSGDPFKAQIDIQAEYLATKVDFSNLSSSVKQRADLKVIAHLTETLLKPAIDFEFQLPAGSPINDYLVLKRLAQFREDKNDLNKQVTSLLIFNTFISASGGSQGLITAGSGINILSNTIGGVVSNAISGFFNKLLSKYIKNLTVSIDVNSSVTGDLQTNVEKLQTAAKSNFVYTLYNGRLIISAGLNLDYNNPYTTANRNSNLLVTPDITFEWLLTKDGRVRIVGFNRTNFDLVSQRNRTGISLSYRKEADLISQLFLFRSGKKIVNN
jgi:hypothetical protein